jgi:hypothetical protein
MAAIPIETPNPSPEFLALALKDKRERIAAI